LVITLSGIAGILYFNERTVSSELLRNLANSLAHRGVDGIRTWSDGFLGLANCQFFTTPESGLGQQPFVLGGGRLVITADARIDNRQELARSLAFSGEEAQKPDEFYILMAYEKWGRDCAGKLLGDFAFVIWDRKQNQLFCARDHMGVQPFYYYRDASVFVFASEIKTILALDEIPCSLNESCLLDYLLDDRQDKEITFYRGIYRLAPANLLLVSPGKFRIDSYWSLDPQREIRFHDSREYAGQFLDLYTQAIKARLRSALPLGSALSGGLDSSSIACIARDILAASGANLLNTCSAIFSGLAEPELSLIDERRFVEKVLAIGGFQPCFVDMGSIGPLTDLQELLRILDEPISAPTLPIFHKIYKTASCQGVGVYLEGFDGDLIVSHGYERFFELARSFKWVTWIKEVRDLSRRSGRSLGEVIKLFTIQSLVPPQIYQAMRELRRRKKTRGNILDYINQDFVQQEPLKKRIEWANQLKFSLPNSARLAHYRELTSGMVPLSLELIDKISAQCNIEVRYPFYDKRMVEYCLAVPIDQKLSGGWTRHFFRNSLEGIVPEDIRWRYSKADFRPFFKNGMLRFSESLFKETVIEGSNHLEPYLDTVRLTTLYQQFASGANCSITEMEILYRSVLLSKWIEINQPMLSKNIPGKRVK
jgi:asparagine synthase (glutamine-hydrolysing)